MITGIDESKVFKDNQNNETWECKCKFGERNCNSNQKWSKDKCWCQCKKHNVSEKGYICNPIHVVSKTVNM